MDKKEKMMKEFCKRQYWSPNYTEISKATGVPIASVFDFFKKVKYHLFIKIAERKSVLDYELGEQITKKTMRTPDIFDGLPRPIEAVRKVTTFQFGDGTQMEIDVKNKNYVEGEDGNRSKTE